MELSSTRQPFSPNTISCLRVRQALMTLLLLPLCRGKPKNQNPQLSRVLTIIFPVPFNSTESFSARFCASKVTPCLPISVVAFLRKLSYKRRTLTQSEVPKFLGFAIEKCQIPSQGESCLYLVREILERSAPKGSHPDGLSECFKQTGSPVMMQ